MDRVIYYESCNAGHKTHDTKIVPTVLGDMLVYDWEKYKDQPGVYCPGQDDISRTLINGEAWEKHMAPLVNSILAKGDKNKLVIDVGSHIGWYSRMAEQFGYKVEAFDGCEENIKLARLNAPKTEPTLLWFEKNVDSVYESDKEVEFLKMDIEGNEQYAVEYFMPILPVTKNILIEVSPTFNDSYPALIEKLKNLGFDVFEIDGTPFNFDFNFLQKDLWLRRSDV